MVRGVSALVSFLSHHPMDPIRRDVFPARPGCLSRYTLIEGCQMMNADEITRCGNDAFIPKAFQFFIDALPGNAKDIAQFLLGYFDLVFLRVFLIGPMRFSHFKELIGQPNRYI